MFKVDSILVCLSFIYPSLKASTSSDTSHVSLLHSAPVHSRKSTLGQLLTHNIDLQARKWFKGTKYQLDIMELV